VVEALRFVGSVIGWTAGAALTIWTMRLGLRWRIVVSRHPELRFRKLSRPEVLVTGWVLGTGFSGAVIALVVTLADRRVRASTIRRRANAA